MSLGIGGGGCEEGEALGVGLARGGREQWALGTRGSLGGLGGPRGGSLGIKRTWGGWGFPSGGRGSLGGSLGTMGGRPSPGKGTAGPGSPFSPSPADGARWARPAPTAGGGGAGPGRGPWVPPPPPLHLFGVGKLRQGRARPGDPLAWAGGGGLSLPGPSTRKEGVRSRPPPRGTRVPGTRRQTAPRGAAGAARAAGRPARRWVLPRGPHASAPN